MITIPAYKDTTVNTWYCKFYYNDWKGERKQKFKRGFKTKKEALNYEIEFIKQQTNNNDMALNSLVELYFNDLENRLKLNTINTKRIIFDTKILPFFKDMPLNDIKPTNIRAWQNEILNQGYTETYIKSINNQLVALFNYAIKYYGLKDNPCRKAGTIGKKKAQNIDFWTLEEFKTFISYVDVPICKLAFNVLYYTGIRQGELFALTVNDIDLQNNTISINKSLQRIGQNDIITEPKTPKSKRFIVIPEMLKNELKEYIN
ncbi:MAG: site-specific integrase, partial [Eubacteriales bacterium]|nr:site-specific integrase [Eubacteriales bacterium]